MDSWTSQTLLGEQAFLPQRTMTPRRLGEDLARLVWESFSDFVTESSAAALLAELDRLDDEGVPDENAAEEILIFLLWAHTRGVQQAFLGRIEESRVKDGLDALHRAVFEDMIRHGTPANQIPIFEQRVATRYQEYSAASESSDDAVGRTLMRHLGAEHAHSDRIARSIASDVIAVVRPLKDYLEDVDLSVPAPGDLPT